jgi:hypothetical protein
MKRNIIFILIISSLFAKDKKFKIGVNISYVYENGENYPVISLNAGYYPYGFLSLETGVEYVKKSSYQEFNIPFMAFIEYRTKYIKPYAGLGIISHFYSTGYTKIFTLGYRITGGMGIFDTKGGDVSIEISYDVPDFKEGRGRLYLTVKGNRDFEF